MPSFLIYFQILDPVRSLLGIYITPTAAIIRPNDRINIIISCRYSDAVPSSMFYTSFLTFLY
jgi:hypothetical protein